MRLLSDPPQYSRALKKGLREAEPTSKAAVVIKRQDKEPSEDGWDLDSQQPPDSHIHSPNQRARIRLELSTLDTVQGNGSGLSVCNDYKILCWAAWPLYSALVTHGLMQGTGCPEAEEEGTSPLDYLSLPDSLKPTPLQLAMPHKRWIDRMPFPRLRDNIILLNNLIDLDDFVRDLLGSAGLIWRPESGKATWEAEAWIITTEFSLKWGYLFI